MDWYSIEFLYPNSYRDFIESMFPNVGIISVSTLYYFDTKKPSQEFKNSREEIESDGFMECFKILDKMLMDTI